MSAERQLDFYAVTFPRENKQTVLLTMSETASFPNISIYIDIHVHDKYSLFAVFQSKVELVYEVQGHVAHRNSSAA